ncbi:multicopper oxidase domain-containing protein [Austwickia chelonae]|uniref:multicopper oxidase domain-containing protein n=1 Tax=Austwickia chelonae TaxID=100225 RepID=UPI000E2214DC|nr:multicopper oxidase domain-containing protein [Austwickia chelonae]
MTALHDRRHWPLRDRPALAWLVFAAVLAFAHRWVPDARWLMVHAVTIGALTHAIMVWSVHFTQALLKTPDTIDPRRHQSARLLLLLGGTIGVIAGMPHQLWWLVLTGATLISTAVIWHGHALVSRLRAALPGRFRVTVHYYLAASICMPLGAGLGVWIAHGVTEEWRGRILLAHTAIMVLGWVGLTVTGTLLTLWPTMLRTRIDARAEKWAHQALPALVATLSVIAAGALTGQRWVAFAGVLGYLLAWSWTGRALLRPARQAPPRHFATWSATAAICWFVGTLVVIAATLATSTEWARLPGKYTLITPALVVGFGVQLLTGALAHLVPVVIGGGARAVRAAQAEFDRFAAARVVIVNSGLLLCLLPVPSWVRVTCSVLVLLALMFFLPATFRAFRAGQRAKDEPGPALRAPLPPLPGIYSPAQLVAAACAIVLAVTVGVAVDPTAAGITASGLTGGSSATGQTTRVRVETKEMKFFPSTIDVPRGNRLEVELVNLDQGMTHDLVLDNGAHSRRLDPGDTQVLDAGVIDKNTEGWCSIVGHRQMGMVLSVRATGLGPDQLAARDGIARGGPSAASSPAAQAPGGHGHGGTPGGPRLGQKADDDFRAVKAELSPLTDEKIRRHTFTVEEVELEVSPGVKQKRWTFNGAVPGPTLHGRIGDVFEITLVNKGTMGHSIDFHAGDIAPDQPMRTIAPGESLLYRFTANRAGIWMYHCSTMPMATHIAAGMHGAVVIEPEGLPQVDRSYVLVQSEVFVDGDGTTAKEIDAGAVAAEKPSAVVFNGIANQYDARPLPAKVGDRVRFWVVDVGPNRPTSFHVVGGQFDTVYFEGAYQLRNGHGPGTPGFAAASAAPGGDSREGARGPGGSQALGLQAAQGGFVEMTPKEAGHYAFVSHIMVDAERGAHGVLKVSP